ncbi:MAG: PcfK-like protein [Bacteroidales bacterium]|nr:PcfK-like protein [Bacteroidales bacterium]
MKAKEKQLSVFEETIKRFLDEKASKDAVFLSKYANHKKSIEECCRYIYQEVQKTGRQGFADEEIFGMAIHYFDEEDIKVTGTMNCKVVVNREIQLTEEEKAKLAEEARKEVEEEEKNKVKAKIRADQEKEAKRKAEKEKRRKEKLAEEEKDGMLFTFDD